MTRLNTVTDMIAAVRSLIDEDNTAHIDDLTDILPSLNRGQDAATDIVMQKYQAPLLTYTTQVLASGTQEYELPVGVFEDRLEKVEIMDSTGYVPIPRVSYRDVSLYDTNTTVPFPIGYYITENKLRLVPSPNGEYSARLWYIKTPPQLTKSQGRVTTLSVANNYFLVDEAGEELSEDIDSLNSFINIVSGTTGRIKGTFQIQYIDGQKIAIKTALGPNRTQVFGQTVLTSLTTDLIALDDYICLAEGTCTLYMLQPFYNYIVAYAVAEIKGEKLSEENQALYIALDKAEKRLERLWVAREQDLSVKRKNRNWKRRGWF